MSGDGRSTRRTTIAEALYAASARIGAAGSTTARLDADVLLRHVLGISRAQLFARLHEPLPPDAVVALDGLVARRANGEPVAYLTGRREFMGLSFKVTPEVLVPRPESEHLVEWALGWLSGRPGMRVVDIGTGSGIIAVAIAHYAPQEVINEIWASDVSPEALAVARDNVAALAPGRVKLVQSDLFSNLPGRFNLVLANLPYLTKEQIAQSPSIAAEPMVALDGGRDGLELLERLIQALPRVLAPGGAVALEVDPSQDESVPRLLQDVLPPAEIVSQPDLSGRPRLITATLPS